MPECKARIAHSGKGEIKIQESVGDDIARYAYVSMPPVSKYAARVRIASVSYASPKIVSP